MAYRRPFGNTGAPAPPGMGGGYGIPQGYPDDNGKGIVPGYAVPTGAQQAAPVHVSSSPPASGYHSRPSSTFDRSSSSSGTGQAPDDSKNKSPARLRRSSMDARKQTKEWVRKNYSNLLLYFGLIVGVFFFYHLMSDGDFSFLLVSWFLLPAYFPHILPTYSSTTRSATRQIPPCTFFPFPFLSSTFLQAQTHTTRPPRPAPRPCPFASLSSPSPPLQRLSWPFVTFPTNPLSSPCPPCSTHP